jgi:hypothetical protein
MGFMFHRFISLSITAATTSTLRTEPPCPQYTFLAKSAEIPQTVQIHFHDQPTAVYRRGADHAKWVDMSVNQNARKPAGDCGHAFAEGEFEMNAEEGHEQLNTWHAIHPEDPPR